MHLNKTFAATTTLIGTIIGAGILGIPYVVSQSGFLLGALHLIIIGILVMITVLYLGEITLRTKKNHQLPGYASIYLGKTGKTIMIIAFAFGIYAALLAYLIGEGQSLSFLIFNTTNYSLYLGLAFWIILTAFSYHGLKALEEGEKLGVSAIVILIISILIFFWNKIDISNLSTFSTQNSLLPFGVILFAYLGFAATPEIERILDKQKNKMKTTIISAYIVTLVIYLIFTLVVVGSKGTAIDQLSTLSLGKIYIFLGMITMLTSYLGLSIALINTFRFDYGISRTKSWLYVSLLPLVLFILLELFSLSSFTKIIGISGALSGGLTGILILLMIKKAKAKSQRKPEYSLPYNKFLAWILIAIFSLGAIVEIFNVF